MFWLAKAKNLPLDLGSTKDSSTMALKGTSPWQPWPLSSAWYFSLNKSNWEFSVEKQIYVICQPQFRIKSEMRNKEPPVIFPTTYQLVGYLPHFANIGNVFLFQLNNSRAVHDGKQVIITCLFREEWVNMCIGFNVIIILAGHYKGKWKRKCKIYWITVWYLL